MIYLTFSVLFMAGMAVCLAAGARQGIGVPGLNLVFRVTGGFRDWPACSFSAIWMFRPTSGTGSEAWVSWAALSSFP